ncbi:HipA domain-containing protein [Pseudonocardia oroxyli]|uniref:HipA-like C-terminal domain-containing protein n=1 Tax=Pseudonocardia oroxyli TaxID=366584 RepID=A0A1G7RN13_PSEOR|nr:HipA domain-containing protein [Pseudonocardia oroxyli]SDG12024.1 hypothetical protein SAMN05216377_10977 [Pseudonocardia oroxyli]
MSPFPVIDVSRWPVVRAEPQGRSGKDWLRHARTPVSADTRADDWLFKPVVVHGNGHRQGGDWSEKIVAELAREVGLPSAEVELAVRHGRAGSLSRNVAPDGWALLDGVVLMSAADPSYVGGMRLRGRPGHSLAAIARALDGCLASPGGPTELTGMEVFAGYLMLDAWVANQDRHDRNWAVLADSGRSTLRLAPSYDHTSSLGFNLTDAARLHHITEAELLRRFAGRGRAVEFEHVAGEKVPTLVEHAARALGGVGERARARWLTALDRVEDETVARIIGRVPKMSAPAATFVFELLSINRRRLLDVA